MGESLPIFNELREFETQLQEYVDSVQKFDPNLRWIANLLKTDGRVEDFVKVIINHQNFGNSLNKLQVVNSDLSQQSLQILDELNQCRSLLLELPDDYEIDEDDDDELELEKPQVKSTAISQEKKHEIFGDNPLTTGELLKYAAKLAKFTTIPATSDLNIGPNNYIWPAEDALRKGMLAMAMRYRDELIKYKSDEPENNNDNNNVSNPANSQHPPAPAAATEYQPSIERSNSFDAYRRPSMPEPDKGSTQEVGLDLFDSDEDSD
ncbi:Med4 protein [Saccharomycopsis crataegensis]|uniref:Mediator of RNA polymerase II transcription subunit 4 n=1 Tax=Saccharomycopsis crataegensis TaxID=43959 RepID=A0AAV5QX69_9ASCO|nr:Med4 protein [Saccharomycopsis crataegensis]